MNPEKKEWIRVWKQFSLDEIKDSLLIVGELTSDCGRCKEVGLSVDHSKSCPHCGAAFRFVTSRQAAGSVPNHYRGVGRITSRRPDLIFIEYDDYKRSTGKSKAYEMLGGTDPNE